MNPPDLVHRDGQPIGPTAALGAPAAKRRPWKPLVLLLIAIGLAGAGAALVPTVLKMAGPDESKGALAYPVGRGPLQVTVSADGNVESASNIEVKCRVAGGSTILWIVEDGKVVEEGEEIVRLDTAAIDDKLNSQRIVYEKAMSTEIQAREDLESAKIGVKEYEEGTYIQLLKQVEAEVQIALENLRGSENQLKYTQRMARKGFVSSLQREADEFGVERAKLDLDAANTKKRVLVDFTREKTLRDLEAKREAAAARLRSEQAGLALEKARLERLQDQMKNCVITAPKKGMVVYANDSRSGSRFGGSGQPQVEEGAMVRESQALVRLPDLSKMLVKVTIHESRVDQVRPGLPASIVIQDQEYAGKVLSVANQPQPTSLFSANVKEYATSISIDGATGGLRPGMTAKVTILVASLTDVLTVPVSAVVEQRGQFFAWVKAPPGPQRRPLKLGQTNDKLIEIVDGVKEGEEVLRNPRAMVEEARQEPPFEKGSEDRRFAGAEAVPGRGGSSDAPGGARPPSPGPSGEAKLPPGGPEGPKVPPTALGDGAVRPDAKGAPGEGAKRAGRGSFDPMGFDKDGDKKLSREELPERMQGLLDRLDANKDGFLDASELAEMRRLRPPGGGRPGGPGGGGAPGGGREGPGDGPGRGDPGPREDRPEK